MVGSSVVLSEQDGQHAAIRRLQKGDSPRAMTTAIQRTHVNAPLFLRYNRDSALQARQISAASKSEGPGAPWTEEIAEAQPNIAILF